MKLSILVVLSMACLIIMMFTAYALSTSQFSIATRRFSMFPGFKSGPIGWWSSGQYGYSYHISAAGRVEMVLGTGCNLLVSGLLVAMMGSM